MKNSNDIKGNRTHELLACSAVPQPTAPLRALKHVKTNVNYIHLCTVVGHKTEYLTRRLPSTADHQHRVMIGPQARKSIILGS